VWRVDTEIWAGWRKWIGGQMVRFFLAIGFCILDSLGCFDPYALLGLFEQKEMGYAIKSFNPRTTDRRYPMLPAVITNVQVCPIDEMVFSPLTCLQRSVIWSCGFHGPACSALMPFLRSSPVVRLLSSGRS
jgi:hypothetical protein